MFSIKYTTLFATLTACVFSLSFPQASNAEDYISINLGDWNALRSKQTHVFQYGAEYRFSDVGYWIHPIIGGFGTAEGGAYGYAGINWQVPLLPNQLFLVPNFAVGAYKEGDGKKLGGAVEFRSGIELDYQFPNAQQVGVALNHISNAGIYAHNSGEESILATYSIPLGTVAGFIHNHMN